MEVEDGVTRAGDGVEHLAADASVTAEMRSQFDTGPKVDIILQFHARVDVGLAGRQAHRVVDDAVDAALWVADAVPGAESVNVVDERTVSNTPVGAATIATKAGGRVQNDRLGKLAGVPRFIPVSESELAYSPSYGTLKFLEGGLTVERPYNHTLPSGRVRGHAYAVDDMGEKRQRCVK